VGSESPFDRVGISANHEAAFGEAMTGLEADLVKWFGSRGMTMEAAEAAAAAATAAKLNSRAGEVGDCDEDEDEEEEEGDEGDGAVVRGRGSASYKEAARKAREGLGEIDAFLARVAAAEGPQALSGGVGRSSLKGAAAFAAAEAAAEAATARATRATITMTAPCDDDDDEIDYGSGDEWRVDPSDGEAYPRATFEAYYGGTQEWDAAQPWEAPLTSACEDHDSHPPEGGPQQQQQQQQIGGRRRRSFFRK
jgi:hypothetical protein